MSDSDENATSYRPNGKASADTEASTCGAFLRNNMSNWIKCADRKPKMGDHVIICFWWPDGEAYNMVFGSWPCDYELNEWGTGCLPVTWMSAPEYPEDLP